MEPIEPSIAVPGAAPDESPGGSGGGVTLRAVGIGLALIVVLSAAGFLVEMALNLACNFSTESPPIAPLGATAAIVLLNTLIARRWQGLSRREILVIYAMTTIGAPLVAHGILVWLLSSLLLRSVSVAMLPRIVALPPRTAPIAAWMMPCQNSVVNHLHRLCFKGQSRSLSIAAPCVPPAAWCRQPRRGHRRSARRDRATPSRGGSRSRGWR